MFVKMSNSRLRSEPMQVSSMISMLARAHHEALERNDHLALRRRVMRLQPRIREHGLRRRIRQQHRDVVFPVVDLDDARDLDVADLPGAHGCDGHLPPLEVPDDGRVIRPLRQRVP